MFPYPPSDVGDSAFEFEAAFSSEGNGYCLQRQLCNNITACYQILNIFSLKIDSQMDPEISNTKIHHHYPSLFEQLWSQFSVIMDAA